MTQTYETLLQLPLFLGMSQEEVMEIVGYTKLGFHKREAGCTIVREHDMCDHLIFLLNGEMEVVKSSDRHDYTIREQVFAQHLIEPERMFGLHQRYIHTYTASSLCHLMTISKQDVLTICQTYSIFFFNLMGLISTTGQKLQVLPWHDNETDRERRIVDFLSKRMLTLKGPKTIEITMQTLATAIRESRLNVSRVLNRWHDEGKIKLSHGIIRIPSFENFCR